MPIMHRQFFKILSKNLHYVKTHCNDRNNPFHLHVVSGIFIIIYNVNMV